jgi:hypothetical protein
VKTRIILIALGSCLIATASLASENSTKRTNKQVSTPAPAVQEAAPVPQTLEQMPAVPPQVTYQGEQLTVVAPNSTLGDILKAVHAQTGAQIDLPGNGAERVVGHFGPGPARDVLSALLNGSHFNYVLLGSEANPQALDRVILMAKSSAPADSGPVQEAANPTPNYPGPGMPPPGAMNILGRPMPGRPGMGQPNGNPGNTQVVQGEDATDDSADSTDSDDTDSTDADDQSDQGDDQQQGDQAAADGEQPAQGQQGVKTPEQMLQELQQQQQQQQGAQQPGGVPGVPAGIQPGMAPHN